MFVAYHNRLIGTYSAETVRAPEESDEKCDERDVAE